MSWEFWPAINAGLNAMSGLLLVAGYRSIRIGQIRRHRAFMLCALACSTLFLLSYIGYHFTRGGAVTRFAGVGTIRPIYFTILISHTVLAAAILPMVSMTVLAALRGKFKTHRRIAQWTLPVWLYVSSTGVLVYLMLYQWFGPG